MSLTNKPKTGAGIASLLREAGRKAKLDAESKAREGAVDQLLGDMALDTTPRDTRRRPIVPKIFSVIDYIEAEWGLNMTLFPVQRFIVKLYYNLPLNERDKTIKVTDMLNTKTLFYLTEKEYLKFLYEEGRCNFGEQDGDRRQLILSIGRRAGKCCREGTYILTPNGLREIQTLGDPEGAEYQPLGINVAQEGTRRATSTFFYNGGERDTVRVRSRCGYEIEGTPNHRVRVLAENGTIEWRFLGAMRVGDRIGVHRKTDLWAETPVDTSPYQVGLPKGRTTNLPSTLDEDWGTLLGVLVGDGSWTADRTIEVTVGPYPEWLTQVEQLFQATLGDGVVVYKEPKRPRVFRVRVHSTPARHFLDRLGFKIDVESHTKRVPWAIMQSPKPVVAAFLRGLFETDGSAERGGRIISFSTASAKLASEVQLLLLNFGVISRVKPRLNNKYGKTYHHLTVLGAASVRIFAEQIGFLSERKTSLLQAHLAKGDPGNKSATESIPYQRAWCRRLLESVPKNHGNAVVGKVGWRRSLLRAAFGNVLKNSTEDLSYPRLRAALAVAREVGADPQVLAHFEGLIAAGYFYDEVIDVRADRGQVYDLTVPDGESFVANGLTNHNTTLSSLFASYEVYRLLNMHDPQAYYGLPGGNTIQIVSVATDKDQAGILFREVSGHLSRCEYFQPYILSNNLSRIDFQTPSDIEKFGPSQRQQDGKFASLNGKSSIRVTFKSAIAKSLRGMGNIVVILDEMAHFLDDGSTSADEVYKAVTPSMAAFSPKSPDEDLPADERAVGPVESRLICISSPLNKQGKFYDLYQTAMAGGPAARNMIAIKAPTWEVNPTIPAEYYNQKFHEDPTTFMVEHGAEFSDRVRGWIERAVDLEACLDPDLRPKERGLPRAPHQMGVDIGSVKDGAAIAISHVEDDTIVLDYHEVWYAGADWREANPHLGENYTTPYAKTLREVDRLDFDEIAAWIEVICKRFYITEGIFDRWEGLSLEQQLHKRGLKQFTSEFFTKDLSSKMYQAMKLFMFDQKLRLYDWPQSQDSTGKKIHSPLIAEVLELQATQQSKNVIVVEAPDVDGKHDDMSDALVRSIWLSMKHIGKSHGHGMANRPTVSRGTTLAAYQMTRARAHGGFSPRTVPARLGAKRFR